DGDYFGAVVNLGRRITDVSPPGAVVVSDELRIALADDLDFEWKSLGPRDLKDVGAVPLWTVRPATTAADAPRALDSLARGAADDPQRVRPLLGLAPQELGIYPMVTVKENLVFFGELHGLRRRQLAQRIDEVANALGLSELLSRRGMQLSGGEKRRLHTAMSL